MNPFLKRLKEISKILFDKTSPGQMNPALKAQVFDSFKPNWSYAKRNKHDNVFNTYSNISKLIKESEQKVKISSNFKRKQS